MSQEMNDTTAPDEYTKITWPEVRKGDLLLHENGDHLTVSETFPERLRAAGIDRLNERWEQGGFFPYRKVEPLPTTPGAYLDKDGNAWILDEGWDGKPWIGQSFSDWLTPEEVSHRAPFTRLVPMPTEEQVAYAICNAMRHTGDRECEYDHEATAAVMALLGGGNDE